MEAAAGRDGTISPFEEVSCGLPQDETNRETKDPNLLDGDVPNVSRRQVRLIFAGLMIGMLVAALNLTIVSPALPRIVAELGGMDHYSWVALSATLASAVVVPGVGKLGDLFGRKPFYMLGLGLFMTASVLSGLAQSFWWLVGARVVQGVGMGMVMPLSQAIIGDILSPRERGKYQGLIGMAFGLASVSGPPLGGWITEQFSWRWLFFVNLPFGFLALWFIGRFMQLPHRRREAWVDYAGFATLTVGLIMVLLATTWGGTQYPWTSAPVLGLYGAGVLVLTVFVLTQRRAPEPVIPLYLWKNPVFAASSVASMTLAMGMFGAIYFVPMFAQGVMGVSVASSGFVLIPLDLGLILVSAANGYFITQTGHYKPQMLAGLPLMGLGFYLMRQLEPGSSLGELLLRMSLIGIGLGTSMHTYTVIVQNAVPYRDLGVATSAVQFFRNVGSTVGIALLGTMLTASLREHLPRSLAGIAGGVAENGAQGSALQGAGFAPDALAALGLASEAGGAGGLAEDVSSLFDPTRMSGLPPEVIEAIRSGLAAAFQPLFAAGILFVVLSLVLTALIKPLPLRDKAPTEQGTSSRAPARATDADMVMTRRS
ncbi:MAG: MFS transporter [Firmicutes bacterium]|nr:MFS transporter [Bacillota bacterium]